MFYQINGNLYLLGSIPFNSDYQHVIDFDDPTEQHNYFFGKIIYNEGVVTHVKKDQPVRIGRNIEALYGVNYVMYRNYDDTRWIYAFITNKKYVSEGVTEVTIETDVYQTYQFDFSWNETFIEREHSDRWAAAGVPLYSYTEEGLTIGDEYIKENEHVVANSSNYYLIVSTVQLETPDAFSSPNYVGYYPTPLYYYIMADNVQNAAVLLASEPSIISISLYPFPTFTIAALPDITYTDPETQLTCSLKRITSNQEAAKVLGSVNAFENRDLPSVFATGTLRDKKYESKLLCYPYSFSKLTQYQGSEMLIKHEYLTAVTSMDIKLLHCLSHEPKTKLYISNGYKGESNGKENSLINTTINDLPLVTDYYKNYIMQHKASVTTGYAVAAAETAGAIGSALISGGLSIPFAAGVAGSAISGIAGELAKQKDLQTTPNSMRQMGNNIAFDMIDANIAVKVVRLTVNAKIQQTLADFWTLYGYKSQTVKIPDLRSRYYYNFIKTIGCNIKGNIENGHMEKLKNIFNNGVTIWHNRAGVDPLSYQYDNVEMSLL